MAELSNWPVIVGIGEITDRPDDPAQALEPLALMAQALHRAAEDAGGGLLAKIDSLDVVHQVTWRYERTAAQLCERLGIAPRRAVYGVTGGESPVRYLHEAALRIAAGESEVAAVCGAEAQHAAAKAKSAGIDLPWTPPAATVENPLRHEDLLNPLAIRHGMMLPVQIYPLYENATLAAWGQTPREAHEESASLWSRFAAVAAENPYAWSREVFDASQIATPAADNRLIAHPYTKRMVANPLVNQGAAVILTSYARARAAHVPEERMIFVWGGAAANEPRDYLAREQYVRSHAQEAVLEAALRVAGAAAQQLDAYELYSCFPCVPKMARRTLAPVPDAPLTVTGGLSFFGAPLNNYMTHALCAMTRHLRSSDAMTGLVYGQGEYVTKHHALVVGCQPSAQLPAKDFRVQHVVDSRQGSVPPLLESYGGPASIETHTVIYDRDGNPAFGTVLARTPADERVMARVPAGDASGLGMLTSADRSAIGLAGQVTAGADGLLHFGFR